jgi:hypothetical protein
VLRARIAGDTAPGARLHLRQVGVLLAQEHRGTVQAPVSGDYLVVRIFRGPGIPARSETGHVLVLLAGQQERVAQIVERLRRLDRLRVSLEDLGD